jgi:hypothetical protein
VFHHTQLESRVAQSVQCLTTDWTSGVRSPTGAEDFSSSLCVQPGSGAHPVSSTVRTGGSFPRGLKRGRGVMLTTHPLLVPRLRKSRSYTSCHPNAPPWRVEGTLALCKHLTFIFEFVEGVLYSGVGRQWENLAFLEQSAQSDC